MCRYDQWIVEIAEVKGIWDCHGQKLAVTVDTMETL